MARLHEAASLNDAANFGGAVTAKEVVGSWKPAENSWQLVVILTYHLYPPISAWLPLPAYVPRVPYDPDYYMYPKRVSTCLDTSR